MLTREELQLLKFISYLTTFAGNYLYFSKATLMYMSRGKSKPWDFSKSLQYRNSYCLVYLGTMQLTKTCSIKLKILKIGCLDEMAN